jgi:MFS family permease
MVDRETLRHTGVTLHLPVPFRSLRHRNYRLWFFGQGTSLVGTWMQTMAQQLLVYRLTDSAAALGMVNFVTILPLVPLSLWSGSIADRIPKRTVLIATQSAMLIQALVLALFTAMGIVQVWHVYVLAFLLGAAKAIDMPARQAFVVEMVEGKNDLANAIGLNSAIFNGARILGPAIAGLAVATTGEAIAFLLNGLSFVAVLVSLLMMRDLPSATVAQVHTRSVSHIREGIRFALNQSAVLVLLSVVAVSSFLAMPYTILLPVFANQVLGGSAQPVIAFLCDGQLSMRCPEPQALPLGILFSCLGIGALMGSFLIAALPEQAPRGRFFTAGNLIFPVVLLCFAGSQSFVLSAGLLVAIGVTQVFQNALANTLLQIVSPDALRGRVMSFYALMHQGMTNIGGLQVGLVADWVSAPISVGAGAALALTYGSFVAWRFPQVRALK